MKLNDLEENLYTLRREVILLKKDSHPPVQFEECPLCSALVVAGSMTNHRSWHIRKDAADA